MRRCLILALQSAVLAMPVPTVPAAAQEPAKDDHLAVHHARMTWEAHFAQANVAHDGHLTPEEAKAGYPSVARHFRAIDVDGKGFVTANDIRAWKALRKATDRPRGKQRMR